MRDTARWWQAYLAALTGMRAYGQSDESYSIAGADRAAAQAADLALARWRAIGAQAESSGETAAALYFAVSLHGAWEGAGEMADIDTMLENVKRLDAEATPADAWYEWTLSRDENPTRYNALGPNTYTQDAADADAALIAHYRTAAPLLAAEVERLRAEVERHKAAASAVREEALYDAATAIKEAEDKLYPHARGPYLECRKIIATIRSRSAAGEQGRGGGNG